MSGSSHGARRRPRWGLLLRLLVSAVLLAWLVRNFRGGWERLEDLDPVRLWPAAVVFAASSFLGAIEWALILRHSGVELSLGRLARLYWIGLFFNNFLPTNVGGDVVKVADVALTTGRTARPVAGTVLDRMLGLLALIGLALVAAALLHRADPGGLSWGFLALVAMLFVGVAAALLSRRLGALSSRALRALAGHRLGDRAASLAEEFLVYRLAPGFVMRIFALAVVVQLLRVTTHVMVAIAMGIPLDRERVLGLFVLVPVLGVAMVLPVSFNGIGLRELIATRLLPSIGIDPGAAFALQLATYLVQVVVSAAGGLLFVGRMLRSTASRRSPGAGTG